MLQSRMTRGRDGVMVELRSRLDTSRFPFALVRPPGAVDGVVHLLDRDPPATSVLVNGGEQFRQRPPVALFQCGFAHKGLTVLAERSRPLAQPGFLVGREGDLDRHGNLSEIRTPLSYPGIRRADTCPVYDGQAKGDADSSATGSSTSPRGASVP